jgi:VWFA-related protein
VAASGATTLVEAAYAALLSTRAKGRRSLAILFTDGLDTWSWLRPAWVLDVAKRSETVVYTVELREAIAPFVRIPGVRGRIDQREYYRSVTRFLGDLAEATGGRRLDAGDFDRLQATLENVLDEFRRRYVIAYAPQGVAAAGWHTLEVRVKRRGVTVRARPGYSR